MYIRERAVTKPYWQVTYRYLHKKLQRGEYRELPGTKIVQVDCAKRCSAYVFVSEHAGELQPMGWLYLWQKREWAGWEVMQVFVFEQLRGLGIAKLLYKAAINIDNLMIISGTSHTKHSKALWRSFVKNKTFNIWAHDVQDLSRRAEVVYDEDEDDLFSPLEIYSTWSPVGEDVRLIAIRK